MRVPCVLLTGRPADYVCAVCWRLCFPDGTSNGVLLLNSNGMDVTLNPTTINYRCEGLQPMQA